MSLQDSAIQEKLFSAIESYDITSIKTKEDVRAFRQKLNLSLKELAIRLGMKPNKSYICSVESGRTPLTPSFLRVINLYAFRVEVISILYQLN